MNVIQALMLIEAIPERIWNQLSPSENAAIELIINKAKAPTEGEWILTGDKELDEIYCGWKCSICGYTFCGDKSKYCPDCGAEMIN